MLMLLVVKVRDDRNLHELKWMNTTYIWDIKWGELNCIYDNDEDD